MSLPYDFTRVFNILRSPENIEVWECTGQNINGRWKSTESDHESIQAIVLQEDAERMQILSEGRTSAGGISIITDRKMYFLHSDDNVLQRKQTFVKFRGLVFVLVSDGWLVPNTNKYSYSCARYENNNYTPSDEYT